MKKNLIFQLFIILISISAMQAQNTFSFTMEGPLVKRSYSAMEDDQGNVSTIICQWTGTDYTPTENFRAGILTFNPIGDTSTVYYNLGDTVFSLLTMTKVIDDGYILAGHAGFSEITSSFLLLIRTDEQKNMLWNKKHDFEGVLNFYPNKIFADEHGYYVFGAVDYVQSGPWFPFLARFDRDGNLMRYFIYPDHAFYDYEFVFNPSKDKIWLFSDPTLEPFNGASKAVFDTSFNYLYSDELPIHTLQEMRIKWLNDTSFYLSYLGGRNEIFNNDHELSIALYDTLLNRINYGEFGELNSDDYPGRVMPFDYINPDTIFYTGTIGLFIWPIPGYKNWIMVGQTDRSLNERYRRYFGGDANYSSFYILALKDGGCFVNALKLKEDLLINDLVYFKFNQYGQLVYTSDPAMIQRQFISYPNPVEDYLTVEGPVSNYEVQLFTQDGRLLNSTHSLSGKTQLTTSHLKPGMYFISFLIDGKKMDTQKIIKL
jgi:hypothetical protein